jgi:hypothetical protein
MVVVQLLLHQGVEVVRVKRVETGTGITQMMQVAETVFPFSGRSMPVAVDPV